MFISTKVIDIIFEGIYYTKVVTIITDSKDKIVNRILNELKRGATITDATELSILAAKEELVVKLINSPSVSVASFELSGDLDPSDDGVKYILYVLESPENIDLILDMWSKI